MSSIAEELSGAEVYQVTFVRDYVQFGLHNDGGDVGITAVTDPEVSIGGRAFGKGDAGWRDALCELINSRVRVASVSHDEFRVDFDTNAVLSVSLLGNEYSPEEFTCPERRLGSSPQTDRIPRNGGSLTLSARRPRLDIRRNHSDMRTSL